MTNLKYDFGMKLKYNLIALFFFGGLLAACDPMEDIYNEIDSEGITITKTEEEYILVKADYESIAKAAEADAQTDEEKALAKQVASDLALNSFASAEKYVPAILANMYGSWGKGSTVGVTYNYQEDTSETLKKFSVVSAYTLSGDDYKTIWGNNFLSPSHAPNVEIPKVLATRMEDAKEGDFCLVDYMYDLNDPVEGTDYLSENFNSCTAKQPIEIEGWKQISVKGTEQWSANVYKGDGAAELSAYKADGELENYLITKPVKIESADALLTFDIVFGHYNGDAFSVLISDTYNAGEAFDVSAWTDITDYFTYPVPMESGYTDKTNVGTYSLKSFNGKNIYVAFRYRGAKGGTTTTIQLDNVKITTSQPTQQKPYNSLFQFINGKWGAYLGNDILVVTPSDYDAMGDPGKNDNFSSSLKPVDYLPVFLSQKLPYAKKDDRQVVLYKYYDGKVTTAVADEYLLDATWVLNNNIVLHEKETFLHNGEKWLFDPTITVSMTVDDYQYLVNWVAENKPAYLDKDYPDTGEWWFGASSHYKNFNIQMYKRTGNDPEGLVDKEDEQKANAYLMQQIQVACGMVLAHNYPDAPTQMNGVDLYYKIQAVVYDGTSYLYEFRYKSLGEGQFEVAGDPVKL